LIRPRDVLFQVGNLSCLPRIAFAISLNLFKQDGFGALRLSEFVEAMSQKKASAALVFWRLSLTTIWN
jgi:hypothetical protein